MSGKTKVKLIIYGYECDGRIVILLDDKGQFYRKDLSGLIDMCGERFGSLTCWKDHRGKTVTWTASRFGAECHIADCCKDEASDGRTPEEAVAGLVVVLHN